MADTMGSASETSAHALSHFRPREAEGVLPVANRPNEQLEPSNFARVIGMTGVPTLLPRLVPTIERIDDYGAVYDLSPSIRFVFHVHSPTIWRSRAQLRLPETSPDIDYGTPEMAAAISTLA